MIITVGPEKYEIDPANISNTEAILLEENTGLTLVDMADALDHGSAKAITGLVWLAWRRKDPTLQYEDVVFPMGEVDVNPVDEPADGQAEAAPKSD